MRPAVVFSTLLHVVLLLLILVGLPILQSDPIVMSEPVAVEVVDASALSAAPPAEKTPDPAPPAPEPPPPPPTTQPETPPPPPPDEVPAPPPPTPEPPKPEPPKPVPPPPPPEPEALPIKKMEVPKVQPDKTVELEQPQAVPKPTPKPEPPKPAPKPEPPKKDTPKKDAPTLDSILNSVDKLKETAPSKEAKATPRDSTSKAASQPQSTVSGQSDHLSASEQDALRHQIGGCWNVPVGGKDVQNMVVNVRVNFDSNMRVTSVSFVDGNGTLSNPTYRSFVESTVRAFQQDKCAALNLPREKYAGAGSILFTFSPKDMF